MKINYNNSKNEIHKYYVKYIYYTRGRYMSTILLFFVLPLATIIFAIALEKLFDNPFIVTAVIFAIFLIVTFTVATIDFLIFAIAYTIIALITALLTNLISDLITRLNNNNNSSNSNNNLPNTQACRICKCQQCICNSLRGR